MLPRALSLGLAAFAVVSALAGCSLVVSTRGLVGGGGATSDGGASARDGEPGPIVTGGGTDAGVGNGGGGGFCKNRPPGTICADFTAGDGMGDFGKTEHGGGTLSAPSGSPRAVTASVPASGDKDEAYVTASVAAAAWTEADLIFEVSAVPSDGTHAEVAILYMDLPGDYYELELVLSARPDQNAALGEYADSTKGGPSHPLDVRLVPGTHRATVRLDVANQVGSVQLDGAAKREFPVSLPAGQPRDLGMQVGLPWADSPHEPWAVRILSAAFSHGP